MATPAEKKRQFKEKFPRQISWHCTELELAYMVAVRDELRRTIPGANFRDVFNLMREACTDEGLFIPENFNISEL